MFRISNHDMRLLWLQSNYLHNTPKTSIDLLQIIKDLGFVQLDTIQNVTRAHHHIIWSRNKNYKEHMIDDLLYEKGKIFEHFTHDASILPVEFYPMWKGQFIRYKNKLDKSKYYKDILDKKAMSDIKTRFKNEGPLHTTDFDSNAINDNKMWNKTAHKNTLDYMWYAGILGTAYRKSFRKYYDLIENIIPNDILNTHIDEEKQIDWLCKEALHRLSVASAKEIKNFWDTLSMKEVNSWIKNNKNNLIEIEWENNEGKWIKSFATLEIQERLKCLKKDNTNILIINPFDPAIRDRVRLKAIFDFDYKIEIFIPKAKRIWGYYVYPLLQSSQFIGRIELQANRKEKQLRVINFWIEDEITWDDNKQKELDKELYSLASLIDITDIVWIDNIKK